MGKPRGKKKAFIVAMGKTFGNITMSCRAVDVHRQTYYDWRKNDPGFAKAVDGEEFGEVLLDMAENKLNKLISEGDRNAITFFLKTKGRNRGYIEKVETEELSKAPRIIVNIKKNYKN